MNNMKNIIINDLEVDKIKDNFKPPKMGEIEFEQVEELFERLQLNFQLFLDYVYKNSEFYTDNNKKFYLIKDVSVVIKQQIILIN